MKRVSNQGLWLSLTWMFLCISDLFKVTFPGGQGMEDVNESAGGSLAGSCTQILGVSQSVTCTGDVSSGDYVISISGFTTNTD